MTDLTYSQLDTILRGLGFSVRNVDKNTRAYKHAGGALLVLPVGQERVIPHHLVATRMALDAFGIAEPPEFAAQLQAS
ncbi:hypothetical protein GobsT_01050 [Gemmata obscuriglobus]|uniref:hypothetical protein n=1 Tax=Gemmata TaxID=113 RepID=UPI0011CD0C2A|nr:MULTISPECIES: hypothetical protein [Gemmata]MDY3553612.1 hypothetical protein [Gemmata algarum]QEG25380.1 hypothetical protein GobsT_01050 [Gemmata obscuriglobus]VTR98402.1 unnamed protein product [Gemmata obscuriglobus UQM 2246]